MYCGSIACELCDQAEHLKILSEKPVSQSSLFPYPHYLVLDTNVVLNQIDVFEEPVICNIIILQTVLDEVKHRSSSVFMKLRDIIANKSRQIHIFINEHHK